MTLLELFIENIADICGVSGESIQQDDDKILLGSHELPFTDVFFKKDTSTSQWIDYLNAYEKDPLLDGKILLKKKNDDFLNIHGLNVLNQNIDAGIYEINGIDGKRIVVFTGSINDATSENPDLTSFPEVLLAIAVLGKIRCAGSVSWANILEGLGPFVIFSTGCPLLSLGECGLSLRQQNTFSFTWNNNLPPVAQTRKPNIPEEAEKAYIVALQDSTTADIAFLRLYRVLEILFAGTYKDEIVNADLSKVIALIQQCNSTSELNTLRKLVDNSNYKFMFFTKNNFNILFKNHQPQGNYAKITNWLNNTTTTIPPHEIRALIIYYIRCALVHSKMNEKEPFLIGPFSYDQEDALKHLVEDTRGIIKDLLF